MIFLKRFARRLALLLAMILLTVTLLAACGKTLADDEGPYIPATSDTATAGQEASSTEDASLPTEEDSTAPEEEPNDPVIAQSSTNPLAVAAQPTSSPQAQSTSLATNGGANAVQAEVLGYVKQVQEIFNSKNFTIKGNGVLSGAATALTMAVSGDKTAIELPTSVVLQLAPDDMVAGGKAAMEQLLGKTSRLVLSPERALWVLPGINSYMDIGNDLGGLPLDGIAGLTAWFGSSDVLKNVKASTAMVNGKENLVATLAGQDGKDIARLCFLDGKLTRIEPLGDAAKVISKIDVASLIKSADASYFSTKNLLPLDLSRLQALGGIDNLPTLPKFW